MGRHCQATLDELIAGLGHPSRAVRLVAQRRLIALGRDAVARLSRLVRDRASPLPARWHAIWALDGLDRGKAGSDAILEVVNDPAPSVRIQSIRELGRRRVVEARGHLVAHSTDPQAAVRLEAVTSLGRLGAADAVPAIRNRLDDDDSLVRYAAFTALNRIGRADAAAWQDIIEGLASDRSRVKQGTAFALRETYDLPLIAALARFAERSSHAGTVRAAGYRALFALARQPPEWEGLWWRLGPFGYIEDSHDAGSGPPKIREWAGTPGVIEGLCHALDDSDAHVRRIAADAATLKLDRAVIARLVRLFDDPAMEADRGAIIRALGSATDPLAAGPIVTVLTNPQGRDDLLSVALAAARQQGGPPMNEAITKLAGDEIPAPILAGALWALGELKVAKAVPTLHARAAHPAAEVRIAAARALGEIGNDQAVPGLVACLRDRDVGVRRQAVISLGSLRVKSAVTELMHAYRDPGTRLEATLALARVPDVRAVEAYLDGLAGKSPSLRDDCRKALAAIRGPAWPIIREKLESGSLPPLVALDLKGLYEDTPSVTLLFESARKRLTPLDYSAFALSHHGDSKRGQAVFGDPNGVGCAKCHRVNGAGGDGGPDLSRIGGNYRGPDLIESILWPSKRVADGYRLTTIALSNGEIVSGLVIDLKKETMTLVDSQGQKHVIQQKDIEQRTERDSSPMPDGLQSGLTLQEFADLVTYLESLK